MEVAVPTLDALYAGLEVSYLSIGFKGNDDALRDLFLDLTGPFEGAASVEGVYSPEETLVHGLHVLARPEPP